MAVGTATLIAGGLLAAGTILGISGQRQQAQAAKEAAGEQRKQNAINNAQQAIARNREIRQVIAGARVAQAEQQAAGHGSGFGGAVSAIGMDVATSLGAAQTQQAAAYGIAQSQDSFSAAMQRAQTPNSSMMLGGALSGLGSFGLQGGFAQLGDAWTQFRSS